MNIAGIILAAGASTRMTKHKQLLNYKGQSLLNNVIHKCLKIPLCDIICITGHLDKELKDEVDNANITFIHNVRHKEGMVGSLKLGINHLSRDYSVDAALVLLTDQPLIPINHYQLMLDQMKAEKPSLMATSYKGTIGVPAIYTQPFFSKIMDLENSASAKSILKQHRDLLTTLDCAEASIDVDTDEDYQKLLSQYE